MSAISGGSIRQSTSAEPEPSVNPYVGPRALKAGETIHGRTSEIAEIRGLLIAHRIVLLYSPSGAGKTSLIEAGLRPEMEERDFRVLPTIRVGHELSRTQDGGGPNRYVTSVVASLEERLEPEAQLSSEELASTDLEDYLTKLGDSDPEQEWCLFFDQFEELFTMNPADVDAKADFLRQLGAALKNRNFWALIAMREDFIAHLDPLVGYLPTRLRTRFRLGLLSPDAAEEAARAPASATGVQFEQAAVEKLVNDLRQIQVQHVDGPAIESGPHIEPLQLQVVCRRLWAGSKNSITVADLERLGGVDQALADYYVDAVEQASDATSVGVKAIRDWVDSDLITEDGFRRPVRRGPGDDGAAVLSQLDKSYLVRRDRRNGTDWYELTHDRVVKPIRESNRDYADLEAQRMARRRNVLFVLGGGVAAAFLLVFLWMTGGGPGGIDFVDISEDTEPIERTLERGREVFRVEADANQVITVEVVSSQPNFQVSLLRISPEGLGLPLSTDTVGDSPNPDGDVKPAVSGDSKSNDVSGSRDAESQTEYRAKVEFQVTAQDRYAIEVLSAVLGLKYTVTLQLRDGTPRPELVIGETFDKTLESSGQVDEYWFEGSKGEFVELLLPAAPLDGVLQLTSPSGFLVGSEVDRAPEQAEESLPMILPEDGTYIVSVAGFLGMTGEYSIIRRQPEIREILAGTPTELGVSSSAASPTVIYYRFSGSAKQVASLVATTPDLWGELILTSPSGVDLGYIEFGEFEDSGSAEVGTMLRPLGEDGPYLVTVRVTEGSGNFGLNLTRHELAEFELITQGIPAGGRLAGRGNSVAYRYDGSIGDLVVVQARLEGDLDPDIFLFAPTGDQAGLASGFEEPLQAILTADGEHLLVISAYSGSGDYELRLSNPEVREIEVGDSVRLDIGSSGESAHYQLAVSQGQRIKVSISPELAEPGIVMTMPGSPAERSLPHNFPELAAEVWLDGDVLVTVAPDSGSDAASTFTLTVEEATQREVDDFYEASYLSYLGDEGDVFPVFDLNVADQAVRIAPESGIEILKIESLDADGQPDVYRFSGVTGDTLTVAMSSVDPNIDPFLQLRVQQSLGTLCDTDTDTDTDTDAEFVLVAQDDDGGAELNSLIEADLSATGCYFISAGDLGGRSGDYRLSVTLYGTP